MSRNQLIYTICKLYEEGVLALNSTTKENCAQIIYDWENPPPPKTKWVDDVGDFLVKIVAIILLILLIISLGICLIEWPYRMYLRMKHKLPEEVWDEIAAELEGQDWNALIQRNPKLGRTLRHFHVKYNDEKRRKEWAYEIKRRRFVMDELRNRNKGNPQVQPQEEN